MRLYLVRHGQTEFNVLKLWTGQMDIPLTEEGRQQAAAIRPKLEKIPFDRVYASDLSRAVETQRTVLPEAEARLTPLLREIDVGSIGGTSGNAEVLQTWDFTPYGGENAEMILERVRAFLRMLEDDPAENVVAFAHSGVLTSTLQAVLGVQFDRDATVSRNCAVHVFEHSRGKWRLLAWNYEGVTE